MSDSQDCLFCRIIRGELPADVVLEDEEFIAIRDRYPKAPVHVLVIPRRHIRSLNEIAEAGEGESQRMLEFIVRVARQLGVVDPGYRVIANVGSGGGQVIFHLHWHLIAGKSLGFG